jgi:hypothetical protein
MGYMDELIGRCDRRRRAQKVRFDQEDCAVLRLALLALPKESRELPVVQRVHKKVNTIQAGLA